MGASFLCIINKDAPTISLIRVVCGHHISETLAKLSPLANNLNSWCHYTKFYPEEELSHQGDEVIVTRRNSHWKNTTTRFLQIVSRTQGGIVLTFLLAGPRKQAEQTEAETVSYLLMYYHASLIWLSTRLNPTQAVFDEFTHHFQEIIRHAEVYIKAKAVEQPTFTFEVGAVPPLYFAATKCRIPALRRRALDLLSEAPRKECIFGASSTAEVACRLIEIEEDGLGLPIPDLGGRSASTVFDDTMLPPEGNRIHTFETLKNIKTGSHELRVARHSIINDRFQRNLTDVPI